MPDEVEEDWKTRLQPASIGGVPFFTLDAGFSFGRRLEVNEYPDRDLPHTRDLGRRADRFDQVAFVVGPDYDLQRDRLIEVLRSKGVLELVTERHGTHRVRIQTGSVRESGKAGRFAKITFKAVEAGVNRAPTIDVTTADALKAAAESAKEGSLTSYLLKVEAGVGWAQTALIDNISFGLAIFTTGLEIYKTTASVKSVFLEELERDRGISQGRSGRRPGEIANEVRALAAQVLSDDQLLQAHRFGETGSRILDIASDMAAVDEDVRERLRVLEGMRHDGEDEIDAPLGPELPRDATITLSADALLVAENRRALADLIRQGIVIARGLVLLEADLRRAQEVDRLRDDFLGPIDEEIETAGLVADDDAYISLREFRAAVLRDLSIRGEQLAERADYTPPEATSALLLSQRLYGTGARDRELELELRADHPAFIPALVPIRVARV